MNSFPSIWNSSASGGGGGGISGSGSAGQVSFWSGASAIAGTSNFYWDNTNNFLGIMTSVPTHSITLGSSATGFVEYNTADQTTNYERARIAWATNIFSIGTENAGTGNVRNLRIFSGTRTLQINNAASTSVGFFDFSGTATATAGSTVSVSGTVNASTGIQNGVQVTPSVTQSGTASFKAIYASPFVSTTGSGGALLLDIGTNSAAANAGTHSSVFSVSTTGAVFGTSIGRAAPNVSFTVAGTSSSVTSPGIVLSSGTYNGASVAQTHLSITSTYNQSGTSSGTDLLINRTQTAVGSGSQLFIDAQVGGTSRFSVSNIGDIVTSSTATSGYTLYNTSDQTTNYERARLLWSANVFSLTTEAGGTGTVRPFSLFGGDGSTISVSGRVLTIRGSSAGVSGAFVFSSSTSGGSSGVGTANTFSASGGSNAGIAVVDTVTQSGTAGYRGLWVSPFLSTTGSGSYSLIDLGTNSAAAGGGTHTTRFAVSSLGRVGVGGTAPGSTMMFVTIGTTTDRGMIIRGAVSQTGDLLQMQDSSAAELVSVRSDGRFNIVTANTSTTATAGAQSLPANPDGFIQIYVNGVAKKVPYYAN